MNFGLSPRIGHFRVLWNASDFIQNMWFSIVNEKASSKKTSVIVCFWKEMDVSEVFVAVEVAVVWLETTVVSSEVIEVSNELPGVQKVKKRNDVIKRIRFFMLIS